MTTKTPADLLIHIGYHKTGTTFLQTGLFEDEARGFTRPWNSGLIRETLVLPSDFEFDPERAREIFAPELEKSLQRSQVPVISDERLSGSPHAGGFDSARIADRLAQVFPRARILIGIREQRSAIYSVYQQYVRNGGAAPLGKYLRPRNVAEIPQFSFEHFEYHHLVGRYQTLFGAERVLVLPFEWLRADSVDYVRTLASFLKRQIDLPVTEGQRYASMSALTVALKRRANFWLVRNSLNPAAPLYMRQHEARFEVLDRWISGATSREWDKRSRKQIEDMVGRRYASSNSNTTELTGLPLLDLGYDLPGRASLV